MSTGDKGPANPLNTSTSDLSEGRWRVTNPNANPINTWEFRGFGPVDARAPRDTRLDRLCVIAAGMARCIPADYLGRYPDTFAAMVADTSRAILAKLEEE